MVNEHVVYGTRRVQVCGTRRQTVYGTFLWQTSGTIRVQWICFLTTFGHQTRQQTREARIVRMITLTEEQELNLIRKDVLGLPEFVNLHAVQIGRRQ